jgi:hypothetical protein
VRFESSPVRPGAKLAGRARIYLVGNRVYQVFIAGKASVIQPDTIDSFFNSFGLQDQGPGPPGPRVASGPPPGVFPRGGPPPGNFPPGGPRPLNRPRPGPNALGGPAPAPGRQPRRAGPTVPRNQPDPSPRPNAGQMLAFYNIPEPASAAIEADIPETTSAPTDRAPGETPGPGGQGSALGSDAEPSKPAGAPPSPLLIPDRPGSQAAPVPEPRSRQGLRPQPDPLPPASTGPHDRHSAELPSSLTPASGGATILSFDWVDRNDDYTGTDGRQIGPSGGKDEHFRLVIDLPPAVVIEEIAILGGEVRWTTRPLPRSLPLAVVSNQQLKNHRQSLRLGPFSGRWTFDLYAESNESIQPGPAFGVEVVVFIRNARHFLTARCQRK